MSVIDDTRSFSILALSAQAVITSIKVTVGSTVYDVYPGLQQVYAKLNDYYVIEITVRNDGLAGDIFCEYIMDGVRVGINVFLVFSGESHNFSWGDTFMQSAGVSYVINAGHT